MQNILPVVDRWYMNLVGGLIKVKMVSYTDGVMGTVVIEFISGEVKKITNEEWNVLDLNTREKDEEG